MAGLTHSSTYVERLKTLQRDPQIVCLIKSLVLTHIFAVHICKHVCIYFNGTYWYFYFCLKAYNTTSTAVALYATRISTLIHSNKVLETAEHKSNQLPSHQLTCLRAHQLAIPSFYQLLQSPRTEHIPIWKRHGRVGLVHFILAYATNQLAAAVLGVG